MACDSRIGKIFLVAGVLEYQNSRRIGSEYHRQRDRNICVHGYLRPTLDLEAVGLKILQFASQALKVVNFFGYTMVVHPS